MEIVFQEKKNGERQLELWLGEERVCVCTDVTNEKAIVNMVVKSQAFEVLEMTMNADDETKRRLADKNEIVNI